MQEKCPVCKSDIKSIDKSCSVCGFADLHREFITQEDGDLWIKSVVEPYRTKWNLDEPEEIRELRKQADSGDAIAQNNLGTRYSDGNGVKQDYEKALYWYRKSAEQGNAWAQYHIGIAYNFGNGVPVDYKIAAEWKEKAANAGNADAQRAIGFCYENGKGVQKDAIKAVYWYKKAAEQGEETAQNNLGMCYKNGPGVAKDINRAIYYYEQAIENGSNVAAYNLACVYDKVTPEYPNEYEKAFKYYKLAEETGYSDGVLFNNLGRLYADGKGVETNYEMAKKYYEKAVSMGNSTARNNLNILNDVISASRYEVQNNNLGKISAVKTSSKEPNFLERNSVNLVGAIIGIILFVLGGALMISFEKEIGGFLGFVAMLGGIFFTIGGLSSLK